MDPNAILREISLLLDIYTDYGLSEIGGLEKRNALLQLQRTYMDEYLSLNNNPPDWHVYPDAARWYRSVRK